MRQDTMMLYTKMAKYITDHFDNNGHSIISPSWSETWSTCYGATIGLKPYRSASQDNVHSLNGTLGHLCLEYSLLNSTHPQSDDIASNLYSDERRLDAIAHFEHAINNKHNDVEVRDMAIEYRNKALNMSFDDAMRFKVGQVYDKIMAFVGDGYVLESELYVDLTNTLGHNLCNGSSDVVLYKLEDDKVTHVICLDFKYGIIPVFPKDNKQLMLYALGIIDYIRSKYKLDDNVIIDTVISQPRVDRVYDSVTVTLNDLNKFKVYITNVAGEVLLNMYADIHPNVESKPVTYSPSDKACAWCVKRKECKAYISKVQHDLVDVYNMADVKLPNTLDTSLSRVQSTGNRLTLDVERLSNTQLSKALLAEPFIKGFFDMVKKESNRRVLKGERIERYILGRGSKRRKWGHNDEKMLGIMLDAGLSLDDCQTHKLKSPAQIESTIKDKSILKKVMKSCISIEGRPVIKLDNGSNKTLVSEIFNN